MDRRESFRRWYVEDEARMRITVEEGMSDGSDIVLPATFEVCETCDGRGSHVNPSIDSHGISPEEFAEDPDFAEDYFSGVHDVGCAECGGKRVVLAVDRERADPAHLKAWDDAVEYHHHAAAQEAYERRMGF